MSNALTKWVSGFKPIRGDGATTIKPADLIEPDFIGDARIDLPNEIQDLITCTACTEDKPEEIAQFDWMKLSIGMTNKGRIQIWCLRHNNNVTLFSAR